MWHCDIFTLGSFSSFINLDWFFLELRLRVNDLWSFGTVSIERFICTYEILHSLYEIGTGRGSNNDRDVIFIFENISNACFWSNTWNRISADFFFQGFHIKKSSKPSRNLQKIFPKPSKPRFNSHVKVRFYLKVRVWPSLSNRFIY